MKSPLGLCFCGDVLLSIIVVWDGHQPNSRVIYIYPL